MCPITKFCCGISLEGGCKIISLVGLGIGLPGLILGIGFVKVNPNPANLLEIITNVLYIVASGCLFSGTM